MALRWDEEHLSGTRKSSDQGNRRIIRRAHVHTRGGRGRCCISCGQTSSAVKLSRLIGGNANPLSWNNKLTRAPGAHGTPNKSSRPHSPSAERNYLSTMPIESLGNRPWWQDEEDVDVAIARRILHFATYKKSAVCNFFVIFSRERAVSVVP